jgi:hypothetical protein
MPSDDSETTRKVAAGKSAYLHAHQTELLGGFSLRSCIFAHRHVLRVLCNTLAVVISQCRWLHATDACRSLGIRSSLCCGAPARGFALDPAWALTPPAPSCLTVDGVGPKCPRADHGQDSSTSSFQARHRKPAADPFRLGQGMVMAGMPHNCRPSCGSAKYVRSLSKFYQPPFIRRTSPLLALAKQRLPAPGLQPSLQAAPSRSMVRPRTLST